MIEFKKCTNSKCKHNGELQPIENFDKNKNKEDGYNDWCKDCKHEHYLEKREKIIKKNQKKYNEDSTFREEKHRKMKEDRESPAIYEKWKDRLKYFPEEEFACQEDGVLLVRCKKCKEFFAPTRSQMWSRWGAINNRYGDRTPNLFLYCSDKCKNECPHYGKILDPNIPSKRLMLSKRVEKEVYDRADNKCEITGVSADDAKLVIHHVIPKTIAPELFSDLDNLILVSEEVHKELHRLYPECELSKLKNGSKYRDKFISEVQNLLKK